MSKYGVFDVTGPIMIGPSSSHTAGAAKLARMAKKLIGNSRIQKVDFYLHGSFRETYQGHGTDKALVGGILGFGAEDERIKTSFSLAKEAGIQYHFIPADLGDVHPNTVKFHIVTQKGIVYEIMGSSLGGGKVVIVEVDGISMNFTGNYPILITKHKDTPGVIAKITTLLYACEVNIGNMKVKRDKIENRAMMYIEIDGKIDCSFIDKVREIEEVKKAILLEKQG